MFHTRRLVRCATEIALPPVRITNVVLSTNEHANQVFIPYLTKCSSILVYYKRKDILYLIMYVCNELAQKVLDGFE